MVICVWFAGRTFEPNNGGIWCETRLTSPRPVSKRLPQGTDPRKSFILMLIGRICVCVLASVLASVCVCALVCVRVHTCTCLCVGVWVSVCQRLYDHFYIT